MTQPVLSGKLSQLHYRQFPVFDPASFWIDESKIGWCDGRRVEFRPI